MLQSAKARGHEREIPPSIGRRAPLPRHANVQDDVSRGHCQSRAVLGKNQFASQLASQFWLKVTQGHLHRTPAHVTRQSLATLSWLEAITPCSLFLGRKS